MRTEEIDAENTNKVRIECKIQERPRRSSTDGWQSLSEPGWQYIRAAGRPLLKREQERERYATWYRYVPVWETWYRTRDDPARTRQMSGPLVQTAAHSLRSDRTPYYTDGNVPY